MGQQYKAMYFVLKREEKCLNKNNGHVNAKCLMFIFFQAEDGIRDFCLSRGLGDVYKRQQKTLLN